MRNWQLDQCGDMEVCWLLRVTRGQEINSLGLKLCPKHKPEQLKMISAVLTKLVPKITWKMGNTTIKGYLYYLNSKRGREVGQRKRRKHQSHWEIQFLRRSCVLRDWYNTVESLEWCRSWDWLLILGHSSPLDQLFLFLSFFF